MVGTKWDSIQGVERFSLLYIRNKGSCKTKTEQEHSKKPREIKPANYIMITTLEVLVSILFAFAISILITAPYWMNVCIKQQPRTLLTLQFSSYLTFLPPNTQNVPIITCCCPCNSPVCRKTSWNTSSTHVGLKHTAGDCSKRWVTKLISWCRITFLQVHTQLYMQWVPDI